MKYKLIKCYPTSESVGQFGCIVDTNFVSYYDKKIYENNPEFWQKVEENEYVIMMWHGPVEKLTPQSIKRLSDDEIFSVGNPIKLDNSSRIFTIERFDIDGSFIRIIASGMSIPLQQIHKTFKPLFKVGERYLDTIINKSIIISDLNQVSCWVRKVNNSELFEDTTERINRHIASGSLVKQEPIFKTSDGVDIYKGDVYWYVDPYFSIYFRCCQIESGKVPEITYFSTEELAEQYIYENKKIYSRGDLQGKIDSAKAIIGTRIVYGEDACNVIQRIIGG
ncbi:MAG: hypothetical protein HGA35_04340 [Erysipelotrichaceae bacterium]|nr:hypothetical protein [Erysipelotrichaceae bacterium]